MSNPLPTIPPIRTLLGKLELLTTLSSVRKKYGSSFILRKKIGTFNIRWVFFGLFAFLLLFLPSQNVFERLSPNSISIPDVQQKVFILPTPASYPVNTTAGEPPFLTAQSVLVVDVDSATVMYEKNADAPLPPASTTKLMTALVALDAYKLDTILTVGNVTTDGRIMGLVPGERLSVESLLYGILVHSANDAAEAVAYAYPGGYEEFIRLMNKKAHELHMKHAVFKNPTGLHHPEHVMSARDLLILSMVAVKHPTILKIASTRTITVPDDTYTYFHDLANVNELLGVYPGIAGLKTGYTPESGESLVTLYKQPHIRLLCVLLGSGDRFGETITLLSWATSAFSWQRPYVTDLSIQQ